VGSARGDDLVMRLPRELWWIAGLTLLTFALIWAMTGGGTERGQAGLLDPSIYSSDPQGTRALFLTLQGLGYDARRFRTPFLARTLPGHGVIVVVEPTKPVLPAEWKPLRQWIERGHRAVLISALSLPGASPAVDASTDLETAVIGGPLTRARAIQPTDLARGVGQLAVRSPMRIQFPARRAPAEAGEGPLLQPNGSPAALDDLMQTAVPLFRDEKGVVVGYARLGKGDLIVVASPWSVSNEGIGEADNLAFVLNALGPPTNAAPVYFDEYHHGYGERLAWHMTPVPLKLAAAQLLLGVLIVMYARGRRFGSAIPLDRGKRERSEYLGTMTSLLQRGRATRLAVRTSYDAALPRLRLELGLARDAGSDAVIRSASRISESAGRQIELSLRQCEQILGAAGEVSEARAMSAVRALDESVRSLRQM